MERLNKSTLQEAREKALATAEASAAPPPAPETAPKPPSPVAETARKPPSPKPSGPKPTVSKGLLTALKRLESKLTHKIDLTQDPSMRALTVANARLLREKGVLVSKNAALTHKLERMTKRNHSNNTKYNTWKGKAGSYKLQLQLCGGGNRVKTEFNEDCQAPPPAVKQKSLADFSVGAIETALLTRYRTDPQDDPLFVLAAIANAKPIREKKETRTHRHERFVYKTRSPEQQERRRSPRGHPSSDRYDRERRPTPPPTRQRRRRSPPDDYRAPWTPRSPEKRAHDSRDDRRDKPGDRHGYRDSYRC